LNLVLLLHSYLPPHWSSSCWGTLEAPSPWSSYGFHFPEALSYSRSEALVMEVSAKGGGWRGSQQDEGGRWVGRKKGGRWVGVGRCFPKKNLVSGVGQKKISAGSLKPNFGKPLIS
jgi:hypothetical protein